MEENQKLLKQNEKLKENRINVVQSKEVQPGFTRSMSDGAYHLVSLESHVALGSERAVDERFKKVALCKINIMMYF